MLFVMSNDCQPYWWSERENSSPARAMVLAHQLFDLIEARLGRNGSSLSVTTEDSSPQPDLLEQTTATDKANVPKEESVQELQHLFRARDEALLRMIAASNSEHVDDIEEIDNNVCRPVVTSLDDSEGCENSEVLLSATAITTESTDKRISGDLSCDSVGGAVESSPVHSTVRTTTTSMCSRCREVMTVHAGLVSTMARANGKEPEYTNWTADFIGWVRE